jgi:hypothetical protein
VHACVSERRRWRLDVCGGMSKQQCCSRTHMLQWVYNTDAGLRGSPSSWVDGPAPSEKSRLQVHDSWNCIQSVPAENREASLHVIAICLRDRAGMSAEHRPAPKVPVAILTRLIFAIATTSIRIRLALHSTRCSVDACFCIPRSRAASSFALPAPIGPSGSRPIAPSHPHTPCR